MGRWLQVHRSSQGVLAGELVASQYQSFNYSLEDQTHRCRRFGESFTTSIDKLSRSTTRLHPGIGDLSNYRVNLYLTLSYPLFKPLTLNLNIIDRVPFEACGGVPEQRSGSNHHRDHLLIHFTGRIFGFKNTRRIQRAF